MADDDAARLLTAQIRHQRQRGGLLPAFDQQQNVLSQGCMHVRRYLPDRTGAQATINQQLGQRQKTQLCVAGGDELIGLRNAVALHQLALQRL